MSDILDKPGLDLLPGSIAFDPDIKAMAAALDKAFSKLKSAINYIRESHDINNITDDNLLALKAWEKHVDFYDANLSREVRRELIANSFAWHMRKGTPSTVRELISLVFSEATIEEWYEYGGAPYTFRVATDEEVTDADEVNSLIRAIYSTKNERSAFEMLLYALNAILQLYIGVGLSVRDVVTIGSRPPDVEDVETDVNIHVGIWAGASLSIDVLADGGLIKVPNLIGLEAFDAVIKIIAALLEPGEITYFYADSIVPDIIGLSGPDAADKLRAAILRVGDIRWEYYHPETVVPHIIDLTAKAAADKVREARLKPWEITYIHEYQSTWCRTDDPRMIDLAPAWVTSALI